MAFSCAVASSAMVELVASPSTSPSSCVPKPGSPDDDYCPGKSLSRTQRFHAAYRRLSVCFRPRPVASSGHHSATLSTRVIPPIPSLPLSPDEGPFPVLELPLNCLAQVARLAGRQSRLVCRHLHFAYGPLQCCIRPEALRTTQDLDHALTMLGQANRLRGLDLNAVCTRVRGSTLATIAVALPSIQILKLGEHVVLREEDLQALLPLAPTLKSLDLSGCPHLGTPTLPLLAQLTHIKRLKLQDADILWHTPDPFPLTALSALTQLILCKPLAHPPAPPPAHAWHPHHHPLASLHPLTQLRHLSLACPPDPHAPLLYPLSALTALTYLRLTSPSKPRPLPPTLLTTLAHLPALRTLHLAVFKTHAVTDLTPHLPSLRDLTLTSTTLGPPAALHSLLLTKLTWTRSGREDIGHLGPQLASIARLAALDLPNIRLTPLDIGHLSVLSLKTLIFKAMAPPEQFHPTPPLATLLADLRFYQDTFTSPLWAQGLTTLTALTSIHLGNKAGGTPDRLHHLTALRALRQLKLSFRTLTDADLASLAPMKALRDLEIKRSQSLTGASLAELTGPHRTVTRLVLEDCSRVCDKGLRGVAEFARCLQHLSLEGCERVKGPGLEWVRKLARLQVLELGRGSDFLARSGLSHLVPVPSSLQVVRVGGSVAKALEAKLRQDSPNLVVW